MKYESDRRSSPLFAPTPPREETEPLVCRRSERCKGCPHARHGFICSRSIPASATSGINAGALSPRKHDVLPFAENVLFDFFAILVIWCVYQNIMKEATP